MDRRNWSNNWKRRRRPSVGRRYWPTFANERAQVLRLGGERLPDPRRTLNELGVDSLMGVELCNVLGRGVGKHLAPTILFTYPTLAALADHLADDILGLAQAEEPVETPASANESRELALSAIEQLTEEEINALIVGEFSKSL